MKGLVVMNVFRSVGDAGGRICCICLLLMATVGCFTGTPGERIRQLKGTVVDKGNGVIDLDLSNTELTDGDCGHVHTYCANEGYTTINTLNLSNTAITDEFLNEMALQQDFASGVRELILVGTKTSDAAVKKYQAVNPGCRIVRQ